MNSELHDRHYINDADRIRLGRLLNDEEPCPWGKRSCGANLEVMLEQAVRVRTSATPENLVTMNAKVRLAVLPEETPKTVTLAYPDDVDLAADGVSVFEPLGYALLGSKVGDVIQCTTKECERRFRIVEITYQPEHAGRFTKDL